MPIVLATFPLTTGLPDPQPIFDATFLLVVVFTLLQSPTLPRLAARLGFVDPTQTRELDIKNAPWRS